MFKNNQFIGNDLYKTKDLIRIKINQTKHLSDTKEVNSKKRTSKVFIIILALIFVAFLSGLCLFLALIPSFSIEKIIELSKPITNDMKYWFSNSDTSSSSQDIIDILGYMNSIGFDLKNSGYISKYKTIDDVEDGEYLDESLKVIRNKSNNKISKANADFLMAYLVSDYRTNTFDRDNLDINQDFNSWLNSNTHPLGSQFSRFFGGGLGEHWRTGFVHFWYEGAYTGDRGPNFISSNFPYSGDLYFSTEKNYIAIRNNNSGRTTNYSTIGWGGKYGIPVEFLFAVHQATYMPDLAYDIANSFDTKLNVIIKDVSGSYKPYAENVINHWFRNIYFTNTKYDKNNVKTGQLVDFIDMDYDYEDDYRDSWSLYENKNNRKVAVKINSSDYDKMADIRWISQGDIDTAYKSNVSFGQEQVGDAQRGVTNSTIKDIFSKNIYFRYDGSDVTADAIENLRNKYSIPYGSLNSLDDLSDLKTTVKHAEKDIEVNAESLSGNVSFLQDALNISTILENTHTLDADYIYRDFRELMVEMGYYDKQSATNKVPKIFQWVIPEISPVGYPIETLDKDENVFGTMIHSKRDFDAYNHALSYSSKYQVKNLDISDEYEDSSNTAVYDGSNSASSSNSNKDGSSNNSLQDDFYDDEEKSKKRKSKDDDDNNKNLAVLKANMLQSVSGKKRRLLAGDSGYAEIFKQTIINDFTEADWTDILPTVLDWYLVFNYNTAAEYYTQGNQDEYVKWLKSLGGVFAKYAGPDKKADGTGRGFVEACKYTYGLMDLIGFEYCNGVGDYETVDSPLMANLGANASNNPADAYYGTGGVDHNAARGHSSNGGIDDGILNYDFLTCCNITVDKVYRKAGLFGGKNQPNSSCSYESLVNDYGAQIVTEPCDLQVGDIIECFRTDNHTDPDPSHWSGWGHALFVGEVHDDEFVLYTTGTDYTGTGSFRKTFKKSASRSEVYGHFPGWVGLHLWDLNIDDEYEGYKGNEEVVSPVSGVLLEYGTYTDDDNERINTDLIGRYAKNKTNADGNLIEPAIEPQEYKDNLGYAKILLMDSISYKKLESKSNSYWSSNSLLTSDTNMFKDDLYTEKELTDDQVKWSKLNKTVYAFKEFAEVYENYDIAGNIIYIDGFKCEKKDTDFSDGDNCYPKGDPISIDDFKVSINDLENDNIKAESRYMGDEKYYSNSDTLENRINAESAVKNESATALYLDDMIFIKEGTVLGRTLTDRELLEVERKSELGTYKDLRENVRELNGKCAVIGNYIRLIMRDSKTDTVIENIEDYFDRSDTKPSQPIGTIYGPKLSSIKFEPLVDDHTRITIGGAVYEVYGQNESTYANHRLRDGRTISEGGCGPTALATALSRFGCKENPETINQLGSDVSVESHVKAVRALQNLNKLDKDVEIEAHPKSDLPDNAEEFYDELKDAFTDNKTVVIDLREAEKTNNNFGDVFDNGGPHAHWCALAGYSTDDDMVCVANTCGDKKWFPLKRITDSTFEAVSGQVYNDESSWVGSWVAISK